MKLDQLQYFLETAKRQHIGHAARFLNISPSAISHSIAALEEEFGNPLFVKQGRQIKLTQYGMRLMERAEFLLAEIEHIRDELSSEASEMKGRYRIAATHTLCSEFLAPAWMALQKEHANLRATLHSLRSGEILSRINSGELDLGICFSPQVGLNYDHEIIHEGKLVFCFGKKHPFIKNPQLEKLNHYPAIAALAAQGVENCENHPELQKFKIQPTMVTLFDSYDIAVSALKSHTVWSLLPDFIAYNHRAELTAYVPPKWEANYKVAAVWPKYRIRTKALDCVVNNVRQQIVKSINLK